MFTIRSTGEIQMSTEPNKVLIENTLLSPSARGTISLGLA